MFIINRKSAKKDKTFRYPGQVIPSGVNHDTGATVAGRGTDIFALVTAPYVERRQVTSLIVSIPVPVAGIEDAAAIYYLKVRLTGNIAIGGVFTYNVGLREDEEVIGANIIGVTTNVDNPAVGSVLMVGIGNNPPVINGDQIPTAAFNLSTSIIRDVQGDFLSIQVPNKSKEIINNKTVHVQLFIATKNA